MRYFRKGFTIVEILVVMTIIGLLVAVTALSYTTLVKSSRDARRKSDLDQIRVALENYRSNNGAYPTNPGVFSLSCGSTSPLTDGGGTTYISTMPLDPKCSTYTYNIVSISSTDYTLGAYLETGGTSCGGDCGGGVQCNYCVGPYGQR